MPYRDFTFPKVVTDLGLNYHEDQPLFSDIAPVELPSPLMDALENGRYVTQRVDNEKARSEFIIAPLLLAVWGGNGAEVWPLFGVRLRRGPGPGPERVHRLPDRTGPDGVVHQVPGRGDR